MHYIVNHIFITNHKSKYFSIFPQMKTEVSKFTKNSAFIELTFKRISEGHPIICSWNHSTLPKL